MCKNVVYLLLYFLGSKSKPFIYRSNRTVENKTMVILLVIMLADEPVGSAPGSGSGSTIGSVTFAINLCSVSVSDISETLSSVWA